MPVTTRYLSLIVVLFRDDSNQLYLLGGESAISEKVKRQLLEN
ncbi:hypothetical protein [Pseudalkalibacillus hwajinpoensis]|nr:hypothetical protein [Pseudalkalibacillus hwajinpoensis]